MKKIKSKVAFIVSGVVVGVIIVFLLIPSFPLAPQIREGSKPTITSQKGDVGNILHLIRGHRDSVESVAISPDGRYIVSGSCDKTIRIWRE